MTFDAKVPSELKEIQKWFASIITRPIDSNSKMMSISPSGLNMSEEARKYILPSPTMQADKRIQIYNQQYWWRLITILQENFPLVTCLFGYDSFNQTIAVPYLLKYPPTHWSLNLLGSSLLKWVDEDYEGDDKQLIYDAVAIDYAYNDCFFAEKKEALNFSIEHVEELSVKNITLQPHVHLFELDYNLFTFRSKMLEQPVEYWIENDFPKLTKGKFYFILYRNRQEYILSDTLDPVAFSILSHFKEGSSIDGICEWLEIQDEKTCEIASVNMQKWFQDWTALQILSLD